MADVFISYSRENEPLVRRLAEAVKREGYSLWWDDELPPHLVYGDVIAEEIGKAKSAIVVWSEAAARSEWVRAEADLARNQKKLVQTSIDGRMPPMPFNQLHFVSIGDWRGEDDHPGWSRVKESLAALSGRPAAPRPAYAFPASHPPRSSPTLDGRLALVAMAALLVLGILGAAAFWLTGRSEGVAGAAPGSAPRLSAPAERPPPAIATPATKPPPAQVAKAPVAAQPSPSRARLAALRRHCNGPGRGTPRCRQFRQRMMRAPPGTDSNRQPSD